MYTHMYLWGCREALLSLMTPFAPWSRSQGPPLVLQVPRDILLRGLPDQTWRAKTSFFVTPASAQCTAVAAQRINNGTKPGDYGWHSLRAPARVISCEGLAWVSFGVTYLPWLQQQNQRHVFILVKT